MHGFRGGSMQELPKYLKGRHNCTREDMIHLGGLLFRIQVDSDRSQSVTIPQILKELVPADQINIMTPDDWKKVKRGTWWRRRASTWLRCHILLCFVFRLQHIFSSYNKQSSITVEEAKIRFLKVISTWPTFGCSFFEAKVTYLVKVVPNTRRHFLSAWCRYLFLHSKRARRASPAPSWWWSANKAWASWTRRQR